eukprot:4133385-Prymnesium_polylepis.1
MAGRQTDSARSRQMLMQVAASSTRGTRDDSRRVSPHNRCDVDGAGCARDNPTNRPQALIAATTASPKADVETAAWPGRVTSAVTTPESSTASTAVSMASAAACARARTRGSVGVGVSSIATSAQHVASACRGRRVRVSHVRGTACVHGCAARRVVYGCARPPHRRVERVAEHHGGAEDLRGGVGHVLALQVGRRASRRLVHVDAAAERSRRHQAERAWQRERTERTERLRQHGAPRELGGTSEEPAP